MLLCTAKDLVSDHLHALHYPLMLTSGSGAALAAVDRVSGLLHKSRPVVRDHRVAKKRPRQRLVVTSSNTQWVRFRDCWGRPKCFSGREDNWHDWSLKFGTTTATLSDHASVWMSGALKLFSEITLDQPDQAAARIFARHMCAHLLHLCEGRALAIVRGAPDHNGLEAWRLLQEWYQPKTRSRGLALLNEILEWDFGTKEQFLQRMKDWENATLENNRTASAAPQEEVLVAVLISRSPQEARTYLHVQVREETAKLSHVRQLLFDYLRAGKGVEGTTHRGGC